jgi:hypothetical protein
LYAGLLALPSFLNHYKGDVIWLFNPKDPTQTIQFLKENNTRTYKHTQLNNIDEKHIFIDDVYNTGSAHTMANAEIKTL